MTQNEREELIFDLAQFKVSKLSEAGVFAMAVDQMCALLANESDEQLIKVTPAHLYKAKKYPEGF
tara:strand:- start:326 stop:520 length:195 start_codon:yes stop_codon:yes gene_type:complete